MIKILSALILGAGTGFLGAHLGLADKKMLTESYWLPIKDFFKRYGKLAIWILLLVGFYRVSDIIMGVVANLFYQDLGYSKTEIASVSKVFGLLMTIAGSFIGGFLVLRVGVMRILLLGAILSAVTNLIFMWLANAEPTMQALALVIAVDNLAAGLAVAAFLAWLSSLTSVSFTATQYAIFSSVMTLFP
jgi:PAT family beta-lactamase induction signal transducer AmpG